MDRIDRWLFACEEENWLEDYNQVSFEKFWYFSTFHDTRRESYLGSYDLFSLSLSVAVLLILLHFILFNILLKLTLILVHRQESIFKMPWLITRASSLYTFLKISY